MGYKNFKNNKNLLKMPNNPPLLAKILRIAPGDLCKITRVTETGGELPYFRICK